MVKFEVTFALVLSVNEIRRLSLKCCKVDMNMNAYFGSVIIFLLDVLYHQHENNDTILCICVDCCVWELSH